MIDRQYIWRTTLIVVLLLLAWSGLAVRLGMLHLNDNVKLRERIQRMRTVQEELRVGRGRVLDRNENILALDLPVKDIRVDPTVVLSNGQGRVISQILARKLQLPYQEVHDRVHRPGRRDEPIMRLATEEVAASVACLKLPGVFFRSQTTRVYPHNALACHVLGFANREGFGSAGIEQRLDSYLKGRSGFRESLRDGKRHELADRRKIVVAAEEGADVHLTLDMNVQYYLEKALDSAMETFHPEAAWAIVQDVRRGFILGMAARPAYDLNLFNETGPDIRLNRAIGVNYEPGSVFKIGVVAAALNEGIIATNDLIDCENGMWLFAGRPLKDFHPYGILDVTGVLRKSSNIGAAKIAVALGPERLSRYLQEYGLGRATGIELPGEEAGLLHPVAKWAKVDITRIAMGHTVAVTALQMLNIICCIGNDGFLMKNHIVRKVVDNNGVVLFENKPEAVARPITERTAALMRQMLMEVTREGGTGTRAAIPGFNVAGKTGTAEKIEDGRYVHNANISSFVGILPAERPEIGIIVVLDNPQPLRTGGLTAAPVFAQIAAPVARYLDIRPVNATEMGYYQRMLEDEP